MLAGFAARSLRYWNWNCRSALPAAFAVEQQPPLHVRAADRRRPGVQAYSMAAPADTGPPTEPEVTKRRVREEVKAALRQLSAEQMAQESECGMAANG